MPVTIGALREGTPLETRVSLVPEVAGKFAQSGARLLIEHGADVKATAQVRGQSVTPVDLAVRNKQDKMQAFL